MDGASEQRTMRQARDQYFLDNGFGSNGGYDDAWVDFHLGPLPCPFPNTKGRVRAVKVHDLHHILTGYRTDFMGELEISAWEVGAGCKDFYAAWYLNLAGTATGCLLAPRRIYAAFLRGRATESLYGRDLDGMLDETVEAVRDHTGLGKPQRPASLGDMATFAAAVAAGTVVAAVSFALAVFVVPVGLVLGALRGKKATAPAA